MCGAGPDGVEKREGRRHMSRFSTLLFAAWSVCLLLVGCAVEDASCPSAEGVYQPLYVPLQGGTCGPISNPNRVRVEVGRNGGSVMRIEMFANADVTTEVVMKGCSMRITQMVAEDGLVKSRIDGDPIYIENENELTGMVQLMRWDDQGQLACSGMYDARFTKSAVTIGAAAQ